MGLTLLLLFFQSLRPDVLSLENHYVITLSSVSFFVCLFFGFVGSLVGYFRQEDEPGPYYAIVAEVKL